MEYLFPFLHFQSVCVFRYEVSLLGQTIYKGLIFVSNLWASLVTQQLRIHLPMQEMQVQPLGQEDFLEKEMATLQYACLGNLMDREACTTVHEVTRVRHNLATKEQQQQSSLHLLMQNLVHLHLSNY